MDNLKLIFQLYLRPASALSDIMDNGSWLFAGIAVLVVAFGFFATVNAKLESAYHIPTFNEYYQPVFDEDENPAQAEVQYKRSLAAYNDALAAHKTVPVVGDAFFKLFSFDSEGFYRPLISLSLFYVPTIILLMSLFGGVGSFGLVLRRDYGTLSVCVLSVWAAAQLPFAVTGILLYSVPVDPSVYLAIWAASGLLFGVFMVFCLRTVFGANYGVALLVVCISWVSISLGSYVFRFVSPLMFSPFLIFYAVVYLGGSLGGEVRGLGNALRQKQNLKRFLHNATVNPNDADAHVQLGIIYLQRKQVAKAVEHLEKAISIDKREIDANFELGKLARSQGSFQTAIDRFTIVLEENDKHSLSEIWREVGATYLAAGMLTEARDALEKYVERRSADPEGLYYLGKVLKAQGELDEAKKVFGEAVSYAKASPDFRQHGTRQWGKLAQREL